MLPQLKTCFETKGIEEGLSARPSCRFEVLKQIVAVELPVTEDGKAIERDDQSTAVEVEVEVVLDIAHNEDAMIALVSKVQGLYPNRVTRYV